MKQIAVRVLLVFTASCALPAGCASTTSGTQAIPAPADVYTDLRSQILNTNPRDIGIAQSDAFPNAWGVLMEFHASTAVVTLMSLADGSTSLYFSNGGGIIGAGPHEDVAKASKALVAKAEPYAARMAPATEFPLPARGRMQFYVLTFSGIVRTEGDEQEITNGRHELSPLFAAANEVITQVRLHSSQSK